MLGSPLIKLINSCTVGNKVDLKKICDTLGIALQAAPNLKDYCQIVRSKKTRKITIWLNPTLDSKTKFTLVAIATAEYILHPERILGKGISYDMFSLADIQQKKHTPYIMLATRLVMPERIIEQIIQAIDIEFESKEVREREQSFDLNAYIEQSMYLPQFIQCAVKASSGRLVLDNVEVKHV